MEPNGRALASRPLTRAFQVYRASHRTRDDCRRDCPCRGVCTSADQPCALDPADSPNAKANRAPIRLRSYQHTSACPVRQSLRRASHYRAAHRETKDGIRASSTPSPRKNRRRQVRVVATSRNWAALRKTTLPLPHCSWKAAPNIQSVRTIEWPENSAVCHRP